LGYRRRSSTTSGAPGSISRASGVQDDASTKTDAQFTIYLDGRAAKTGNLGLGLAVPVDLDISDVLGLRFETKDMTPPSCPLCESGGGPFVWGDAMVTR
jgi:hypothetical protein